MRHVIQPNTRIEMEPQTRGRGDIVVNDPRKNELENIIQDILKQMNNPPFDTSRINELLGALKELQIEVKIDNDTVNQITVYSFDFRNKHYDIKVSNKNGNSPQTPPAPDSIKVISDPLHSSALQKAIKDMGLRETFCKGVYCQQHNPDMPAGNICPGPTRHPLSP